MAMLEGKVAIVWGGGGVIGSAVAERFAHDGAKVFLAGRTRSKLDKVAAAIGAAGVAVVDALDEDATRRCADDVVAAAGRIDVSLNAVGIIHVQGTPFMELSLADYEQPIHAYARTHFVTAKAVARPMLAQQSGVILSISTPASRRSFKGVLGFGVTCSAIEAIARQLSGELGPHGIRVVCLRPDAIPETVARGSHARDVFAPFAARAGITLEAMLAGSAAGTLLGRSPMLAEIAATAAFVASPDGGALTATTLNLSCGSVVD